MTAIDGIHYIFDRYAFLNQIMEDNNRSVRVAPDSPADRIRKAITLAQALYHPDRLQNSAKDMLAQAERTSHMLSECKRFLLNDEVRTLYNARLQQFKDEKPDFVSMTGDPIIDIYAEDFDVDSLISDEAPDLQFLEDHARQLTQFDNKSFEQMHTLYQAMPDNPQIKTLYKEALTKKYTYLDVLEGIAWRKLGYANRKNKAEGYVIYADDYVARVNKALESVRNTEIRATLESRHDVARIGMSKMPLLLTYNNAAGDGKVAAQDYALMKPEEQAEIMEKLTQAARAHFDERSKFVQDLAQQKQNVLEELVTFTPVRALSPADPSDPIYHIYMVEPDDEDTIILWATADKNTRNASPRPWEGTPSLAAVLKGNGMKPNSFVVIRNKELVGDVFLLELMTVIDRICNDGLTTYSKPLTSGSLPHPSP